MHRVFDVYLNEKLCYVRKSLSGLFNIVSFTLFKGGDPSSDGNWREQAVKVLLFLQLLVIAVILFPLAVLYLFGLVITAALSLWRLIEHDYGNEDGGGANLEPALNVLYSLALFQGVLFLYRVAVRFSRKRLTSWVANKYGLGRKSMEEYMRQTKIGCEKDPSFAKGRNLVTFAVELIKAESSSGDFVRGARILDKILGQEELQEHHALIRKLVGSASSSRVMKKLLRSLRSSSQYNRKVRVLAARIVKHLAGEVSLASFPQTIRCISSLLETTPIDEQQDDDSDSALPAHYKYLMVLGLDILDKLAADEHNRSFIVSDHQDLISKAMVPVSTDLLHNINHHEWSDIVAASLQFMFRLVSGPGKTDDELLSKIFKDEKTSTIETVMRILNCEQCKDRLQILAIKILTQLPMEDPCTASNMATYSKTKITLLVDIFFTKDNKKDASTRQMAGEALAMLSNHNKNYATIIFKASDTIIDDVKEMLLHDRKDIKYKISAAEILENLCIFYKKDDDYLKKLTEGITYVLPTVLEEIHLSPSKKGEMQTQNAKRGTDDIERGEDDNGSKDHGNVNEQNDDINNKNVDRKLLTALLSLSVAIFQKLISNDRDLAQLTAIIAPGGSASSFAEKLTKMVEENSKPRADCLRILKIASSMIISLIKLNGVHAKAELESLMKSLSKASEKMYELEAFMMLSSRDHSAMKHVSPLGSLVKGAHDLLEKKKKEQNLATTAASPVDENQLID